MLLHSIKHIVDYNFGGDTQFEKGLLTLAGLPSYGTPAFVFISIILFSYKYTDKLPKGFYTKRMKAILLPFICMAVFYGLIETYDRLSAFPNEVAYNLIGYYHGWFILLIFQFYILYHFFVKMGNKISPIFALSLTFVINIGYLAYFNFTSMPKGSEFIKFVWEQGHWVPFLGWFFYFTFAYYCGRHYDQYMKFVEKHKPFVWAGLAMSIILVLISDYFNVFPHGSKRVDMIPLTVFVVTIMLYYFSKIKNISSFIHLISKYSFGIYLLHMFYLIVFKKIFDFAGIHYGYWSIPIWFVGAVAASIVSVYIVNKIPFGKYIVGGINDASKKLKTNKKEYPKAV